MALLEETLKDETIPWEDRYWLDRRVRAAIAQNTHTFFNPAGNPVHIDADDIFPGEYYWREHMLVDPAGWNTPEGVERPILPRNYRFDTGLILNPYGNIVGNLAVICSSISLSRDASIGVFASSESEGWDDYREQYYANLLYPDGTFTDIPFEGIGKYIGTVSQDGNVLAFFRHGSSGSGVDSYVEIFDRNGTLINRIQSREHFVTNPPNISFDGHYASCEINGGHTSLIDRLSGEIILTTEETGTDRSTTSTTFSPDGNFFCVGGGAKGRVIDINSGEEYVYPETALREGSGNGTHVSCSNSRIVTALITTREFNRDITSLELRLLVGDREIHFSDLNEDGYLGRGCIPEVSPNGHFIIVNRIRAAQPLVVTCISGRR